MTIYDAMIIYLAIGAPFGAHRLFRDQSVPNRHRAASAAYHFVFWLPDVIWSAIKKFARTAAAAPTVELPTAKIQTEFETLLTKNVEGVSIFEFRNVFERYVGLHHTLPKDEAAAKGPKDEAGAKGETVFDLVGHENVEIAVKCLNRRNRERILFHQRIAANDFLQFITELANINGSPKQVAELSHKLAVLLNDTETADEIMASFSGPEEVQQWNTKSNILPNETATGHLRI